MQNPKPVSFDAVRQEFLKDMELQVKLGAKSASTPWTYEKRLKFFQREMGIQTLDEVTRPLVSQFLLRLKNGSLPDSRKPASQNYADNHWRHLVGFLKWCRRRGYEVDAGLFEKDDRDRTRFAVAQPVLDELEPKAWSDEEVRAIRAAAKEIGPREWLAVEILLRTGVRLQELCNIQLDDIQGEAIRIGRSKSIRGRRVRTTRYVPLYPEVRRMVSVYIEKYRPQSRTEYLFVQQDGDQLTARGMDSMLDRIHAKAGVSKGGAHRYRHTFGTEYMRKNPNQFKKLKDIMGHADFQTVERYAKFRKEDFADPSEDPFA